MNRLVTLSLGCNLSLLFRILLAHTAHLANSRVVMRLQFTKGVHAIRPHLRFWSGPCSGTKRRVDNLHRGETSIEGCLSLEYPVAVQWALQHAKEPRRARTRAKQMPVEPDVVTHKRLAKPTLVGMLSNFVQQFPSILVLKSCQSCPPGPLVPAHPARAIVSLPR